MAQRWTLAGLAAPDITPAFDAAWEQTGQADRCIMLPTLMSEIHSALADKTVTVPITTTQQILVRQFIGPPMPARRWFGNISMVIRTAEDTTNANAFLAFILKIFNPTDGTFATLASSLTNAGTEFTTAAQTRIFSGSALTLTTGKPGNRLILEIGVHAQAPAAAGTATLRFGYPSGGTQFALTSGLTTDLTPWFEISQSPVMPESHRQLKSEVWR